MYDIIVILKDSFKNVPDTFAKKKQYAKYLEYIVNLQRKAYHVVY